GGGDPRVSSPGGRATSGNMPVVVPTGELLAYSFSGSERGGESRATLQLVVTRLQLDVSESRGMGSLGLLDTPMYLSMVGGYSCQYALVVEALKPDGTRRQLTARGEGRARNDGQAAVRYAVTQAAADLPEQVAALLAAGGTASADRRAGGARSAGPSPRATRDASAPRPRADRLRVHVPLR